MDDALVETSYAHTGGKRRLNAYTINRDSVLFLAAGVSESCNHFTKEHGMEQNGLNQPSATSPAVGNSPLNFVEFSEMEIRPKLGVSCRQGNMQLKHICFSCTLPWNLPTAELVPFLSTISPIGAKISAKVSTTNPH